MGGMTQGKLTFGPLAVKVDMPQQKYLDQPLSASTHLRINHLLTLNVAVASISRRFADSKVSKKE
jgi:hypothetical protein